jgi:hypothetical protein
MKKVIWLLMVLVGMNMSAQDFMPKEVLVQIKDNGSWLELERNLAQHFGTFTTFHIKQEVSKPMRICLLGWEQEGITEKEVMEFLSTQSAVSVVQLNHIIEERTTPNDPLFGNQWHFIDPQDNDIDADLAWDITTGGTTAVGDEIVACIVEGNGSKWDQEDILPNHWVNNNEIAGNGIDDDNNGYVDDYDGWNVSGNNDNFSNGNHGTQVSSMIGSKGNNALGVTGVNWDVKLMQVQMGGVTEANAISAYTYPLVMRQLYNNTNGAQGAFVVVTNSSWGIDNAAAAGYPLWCQMYDTLGHYGILSCAATANNNVNVDNVGDMPTTCPSDFLISVTATNNNDVRTFSGYGTTHIDLGAPGENVLMAGNSNYATSSGTSFATPCVAGAVALLYSAPCLSFATLAHSSPMNAAAWVKGYILNGVDPINNLQSEVLTGGRLNVKNSLDLLLSECSASNCLPPYNIAALTNENSTAVTMNWSTISGGQVDLQIRMQGSLNWVEVSDVVSGVVIDTLQSCAMYEYRLRAACDTTTSEWGDTYYFSTSGCCYHPQAFTVSGVSDLNTTLEWPNILAAQGYTILLTPNGQPTLEFTTDSPSITWMDLTPCTDYVAMVYSICPTTQTQLQFANWTTLGCQSCSEVPVCDATTDDASAEWIDQVQLGQINNVSGSNGGYGDFTSISTTLVLGETYSITVTPGFGALPYTEYTKVWIDWNANAVFEDIEVAYDPGAGSTQAVTGNIVVPMNANIGSVRMRVGMTYYGVFGSGQIPAACGTFGYGEFEDYCLTIQSANGVEAMKSDDWRIFPNPNNGSFVITGAQMGAQICVTDVEGRLVATDRVQSNGSHACNLDLPSGIYVVTVEGAEAGKKLKMIVQ